METTLDEKYDVFVEKYSHIPSIDQFKRFANIKYRDAKNYMTARKPVRKTSADLPNSAPLIAKSRTTRAYSSYNGLSIPPKPKQTATNTSNNTSDDHNTAPSDRHTKPNKYAVNAFQSLHFRPTHKCGQVNTINNINTIKTRQRSNELINGKTSPQIHTKIQPNSPLNANSPSESDHIHLNATGTKAKEYYLHSTIKHHCNSFGQDLRKYADIDATDHNGYYRDMDYKNDKNVRNDMNNINNPYLDNKLLQASSQSVHSFKLYVGIDFGTDGCAISYCLPNGNVYIHSNWQGDKNVNTKIKTRILLDENGERLAFGLAASYMYASNINKSKPQNWLLFERFKMNLYAKHYENNNENKTVNLRQCLRASNGVLYQSKNVFVSAFKYMKEEVWHYLKRLKLHNIVKTIRDIRWIITVPSIWDDIAKNKMREWAISAGLADKTVLNHIKIVYEPDCASLSIQHQIMQMQMRKQLVSSTCTHTTNDMGIIFVNAAAAANTDALFAVGSKYLLIDAGGGTVDTSCHELIAPMRIKMLLAPSGGAWGSCYIDDEFVKLLENIFSVEWMHKFAIEHCHSYYELLNNFRASKHSFYSDRNKEQHNVDLTYEFISFLEEECEINDVYLQDIMGQCIYCSDDICLNGEYLQISYNIWINVLFAAVIEPIVSHVTYILNKEEMVQCKYICLVGGLCASPYFEYKMNLMFGAKYQIIRPQRPIISVVEGAALFGHFDKFVVARMLSKCYGTSVNSKYLSKSWMNKKMVLNLSNAEKQKHYNHRRECYSKIFKPIVHKNEIIAIDGKPIIIVGARNTSNKIQKHTRVKIYQCNQYNDNSNTFFINDNNKDMKLMATACIIWPKQDKERNKIILELYFHDTIICGYVYAQKYPNDKKILQLKYEFE